MKSSIRMVAAALIAIAVAACASPRITLFSDATEPLKEVSLEGTGTDKVLMIPVSGIISDRPKSKFMQTMPSMVQEVVSHLRLAEKDPHVKALLLKVDSPGGTTTASDILYHELSAFKQRTEMPIVVSMMNIATSGGYYISLPADVIMAHPTTVTGSIGVILVRPEVSGLMQKLGVAVAVNKSGANKDMGSPFHPATPAQEKMLQALTDMLAQRFIALVGKHRKLEGTRLDNIADARIMLADDAVAAGLVDRIGYLEDAVDKARQMAGLASDARVVTYRRTEYPDDNLYNVLSGGRQPEPLAMVDLGPVGDLLSMESGFCYIWPQALAAP